MFENESLLLTAQLISRLDLGQEVPFECSHAKLIPVRAVNTSFM